MVQNISKHIDKFPLWAFLFGLFFTVLAYIIEFSSSTYMFGFTGVQKIHGSNPIMYFVDFLSIILLVITYILVSIVKNQKEEFTTTIKTKDELIN